MKAKKNLGQNFLIDEKVIIDISNNINVGEDDLIIEIGPGMGSLTKYLKMKNVPLVCYEIDTDLKPYLNKLEDAKTKIIYQDILLSNIVDDIKDIHYNNLFIVGNLPYYITTPIIKHLIALNIDIKEMIFMVQDEVADRFTALPKTSKYGSITLYLKYYFQVTKLFKVSKKSFEPVPKVESAIIKFVARDNKPTINKELYFKLINDAFRMKRKTLKNNLKDYDLTLLEDFFHKNNLNDTIRAEALDENMFLELYNSLCKRVPWIKQG